MDLLPTAEQTEIANAATELLSKELSTAQLRARIGEADAVSPAAWQACAGMGLLALGLPSSVGGADCGLPEETLLFREIGRHVAPGPFLATVLAGHLALAAGDEALAGRLAAGSVRVAHLEPTPGSSVTAATLEGRFQVRDWAGAEYALVLGPQVAVLVELSALGPITAYPSIDPGVRVGEVDVAGAPVALALAEPSELYLRGLVLVSAQLVGIALAARDLSVEHAKNRQQFGKPIGVNQAIKHKCAEMAVAAERAHSQLLFAAATCAEGRADSEFQARAAKVIAFDAARKNAAATIQVHGGMGWTSEFDAHLLVERAEFLENTLSSRSDNLAALIGLDAPQ